MKATDLDFKEQNLKILTRACQALTSGTSPKTAFVRALDILCKEAGFLRSFVLLFHATNEKLQPFATNGLSAGEFRKLESRAEKSFIGEVFRSGKSVVIPRTSLEPSFAFAFETNKTSESSCVCVPVIFGSRTIGALGGEFEYKNEHDYQMITDFLEVFASMVAQTVKVERAIALEKERLQTENSQLHQELREKYDFGSLVGNSSSMRRVFNQVVQVARSNTTVLLRGESGTGKELIANSIHFNSLRSKKPFVKVACSVLPENLIELELFGQESKSLKKGRIEAAEGGTLLLDEIADLPLQTQAKLLRVLEERAFERIGGSDTIKANTRLIATTNKNLEELISKSEFREDLFYRMSAFTIFLPPLRERKADILLLAERFVEKYEREHGKHIKRISTPAIDMLSSYHFPGNVRELENVIERAVIVCDSNVIHAHHLPPTLQTAEISNTVTRVSLDSAVEAFERDLISDALKTTRGNRAKAAKLLDTTERIFSYKIKKYGIEPRRFRN